MALKVNDWTGGEKVHDDRLAKEIAFRIRCCIPCIVQSFDKERGTIEAQPAIRENIVNPDNSLSYAELPLLINVPVAYPRNKDYGIEFPLQRGDEVLVVFSDLSIDNFWEKSGIQNPVESRRHDLSDGIAIPCALSIPQNTHTIDHFSVKNKNTEIIIEPEEVTFKGPGFNFTATRSQQTMDFFDRHIHTAGLLTTSPPIDPLASSGGEG